MGDQEAVVGHHLDDQFIACARVALAPCLPRNLWCDVYRGFRGPNG
jgi:hypothetical protein